MHKTWSDGVLQFSYTRTEELDEIAAMLAKPAVCEHVFFGPNSHEETRAYFTPLLEPMQASLRRDELPDNHVFTIRVAADSTFVGECALIPVLFGDGNYTIGYQLDDAHWGRGFGTRACEFVVWYGFVQLGARRLSGETAGSNLASARIMQKCGFTHEGVRRGYYSADQQVHDDVLFGLLQEDRPVHLERPASRFHALT